MHIPENIDFVFAEIAKAADLSMKPWVHSVLNMELSNSDDYDLDIIDLILRIESRDPEGIRCPANDLDLEIYRSGSDVSITLSKVDSSAGAILWHGKNSVWMDGDDGTSCNSPDDARILESFARRLRALFLAELK